MAIIGLSVPGVVMYSIGVVFVTLHELRNELGIVSWLLEETMMLMEFEVFSGNEIAQSRSTVIYSSIMRANLLSLNVAIVSPPPSSTPPRLTYHDDFQSQSLQRPQCDHGASEWR